MHEHSQIDIKILLSSLERVTFISSIYSSFYKVILATRACLTTTILFFSFHNYIFFNVATKYHMDWNIGNGAHLSSVSSNNP